MKSSKLIFLIFLTATTLFSAEPSAFGAGDLTSSEPYGLTSNEKVILETTKKLKKVAQKSNYQENQLDSLRERIDGLQSIIESLSRKSHNNKVKLQDMIESNQISFKNSSKYEERLAREIRDNSIKIDSLTSILSQLSQTVDEINLNYITKKEFNNLVKEINSFKTIIAKELKSSNVETKSKLSGPELYNLAKKYYDKKYYTKAIQSYEELIKRNYKPAYSHFMIGEMYFKRKDYANAISYFKKSSKLYSRASYMPKLMLHTAISMRRTGDDTHAKMFFQAVVDKYPNSKEAKEARNYLY